MEKQKMTIHRALSELKVIDKRIFKNIQELDPIGAAKEGGLVNNFYKKRDFEESAKSGLQSVQSLIERKELIKSAIVKSNSETMVTVGKSKMTVSDAITRKTSIEAREALLKRLKSSLSEVRSTVENINDQVEENAVRLADSALGKDSSKSASSEAESIMKVYKASNRVDAVDPLNIEKLIKELEEEVENFNGEVDAVLSESNAVTLIEI